MSNYTLNLEDTSGATFTVPVFNRPLTTKWVEGKSEHVTLNGNVFTYFSYSKRQWVYKWSLMTHDDYQMLQQFRDRQYSLLAYPTATIVNGSDDPIITLVTMSLGDQSVVTECGDVENVTLTLRETALVPAPVGD